MKAKLGTLESGGEFALDLESLIKTRMLIQGTSGSGKSHALRKILEMTHGKVQHFVIDPDGEFTSLREKFDYILVGPGGDVPADPATAGKLAFRLRELGSDVICDLYDLEREEQNEFVHQFLEGLMRAPKDPGKPAFVAIDEADKFAPNNSAQDSARAVINVSSRGRKRGLAIIAATQRISKLHKDVIAETLNKLVGRTQLDLDLKRVSDELGFARRDDSHILRKLIPGQFFAFGPAFGAEILRARIGEVKTKHGADVSKISARAQAPTARVKAALAKLADFQKKQEAEEQDRAALTKRIKELEREVKAAQALPPAKREEIFKQGYEKARIEGVKVMTKLKNRLLGKVKELSAMIEGIPDDGSVPVTVNYSSLAPLAAATSPRAVKAALTAAIPPAPTAASGDLGKTELAILQFLGSMEGKWFTRVQIGVRTGYSRRSSTFQQAFPTLVKQGLVASIDGKFAVTEVQQVAVEAVLGPAYQAPVSDRPEDWLPKLSPTARAIFQIILHDRAQAFTREELSRVSGYSVKSSTFQGAFPELEQLGLTKKASSGAVLFNAENFGA